MVRRMLSGVSLAIALCVSVPLFAAPDAPKPAPTPPAAATGDDGVIQLPGRAWSARLPSGWRRATTAELDRIHRAVTAVMKPVGDQEMPRYVAMILPRVPNGRYALIQESPALAPSLSIKAIADAMAKQMPKASVDVKGQGPVSLDSPTFETDAAQGRVRMLASMQSGDGELGMLTATIPGREQTLFVHAYAPRAKFDAARADLQNLTDSVRWDPGFEYVFGSRSASGGFDFRQLFAAGLIGACIGLGSYLVKRVFKRA